MNLTSGSGSVEYVARAPTKQGATTRKLLSLEPSEEEEQNNSELNCLFTNSSTIWVATKKKP